MHWISCLFTLITNRPKFLNNNKIRFLFFYIYFSSSSTLCSVEMVSSPQFHSQRANARIPFLSCRYHLFSNSHKLLYFIWLSGDMTSIEGESSALCILLSVSLGQPMSSYGICARPSIGVYGSLFFFLFVFFFFVVCISLLLRHWNVIDFFVMVFFFFPFDFTYIRLVNWSSTVSLAQ